MDYENKKMEALEELKSCVKFDCEPAKTILKLFPELEETDYVIKHRLMQLLDYFRGRGIDNAVCARIENWLEKQCEKPTDKIKPKFKVGDWVTNGDYTWKIIDVKVLDYILQSKNGEIVDDTISYVDEEFNLWTIKDAKDGDVLSTTKNIFIYNGNYNRYSNALGGYCSVKHNGRGLFIPEEDEKCRDCRIIGISDATPATKEQSDTLIKAMNKAGWEFDFEKKELKWILSNKENT